MLTQLLFLFGILRLSWIWLCQRLSKKDTLYYGLNTGFKKFLALLSNSQLLFDTNYLQNTFSKHQECDKWLQKAVDNFNWKHIVSCFTNYLRVWELQSCDWEEDFCNDHHKILRNQPQHAHWVFAGQFECSNFSWLTVIATNNWNCVDSTLHQLDWSNINGCIPFRVQWMIKAVKSLILKVKK